MNLNHPTRNFLSDSDIEFLFDSPPVTQIDDFCERLDNLAEQKYQDEDDCHKFKGDVFELFAEFLLKIKGSDNRLAITNYECTQHLGVPDYGMDGVGLSTINGKIATVQVKYRQPHITLTWNEGKFGSFNSQSLRYIIKNGGLQQFPCDNTQLLFITSANEIHHSVDEISEGTIRTISRPGLRQLCDGVCDFWQQLVVAIKESRTRQEIRKPFELRDHQKSAVQAIIDDMRLDDGKGRVILPTGTGKTLIQAQAIVESYREFGHRCFLVLSPRILLSFQHLVSISDHLIRNGVEAEFLNVNSGNFDEQLINEERMRAGQEASRIQSTTSPEDIKSAYHRAIGQNKILVISSNMSVWVYRIIADVYIS